MTPLLLKEKTTIISKMTNQTDNKFITPTAAISLSLFAFLLFTLGDTLGKWLQTSYDAAQILVTINMIGFFMMVGVALYKRGAKNAFKSKQWKLLFLRGFLMAASTTLVFVALKHMPLPDFYGIIFTTPFLVAIFSRIFLKEKIPPSRIIAICVGFLGVIVISGAKFSNLNIGFAAALTAAIIGAIANMLANKIGTSEEPTNFGIATHSAMALLNIPMAVNTIKMPALTDWMLLTATAALYSIAMMAISVVLARSKSVSQVAPLQYTQMLWGILFGWLIFNQTPTLNVLAGSMLVIGSGIYVMHSLKNN
jgi:drug/metabolite transporter (DMT)-like permease